MIIKEKIYNHIFCITALLFLSVPSFAQAVLKGIVKDAANNEAAMGAMVELSGTKSVSVLTDLDGSYEFTNIAEGTYKIVITYVGFQSYEQENVVLKAGEEQVINVDLTPVSKTIDEVKIVSQRVENTAKAVLSEIRTAQQVVSGVSQQQIKLSEDKNAAQVMSRIPGVTVVDGRFIMVRGIPERYNQVLLNNAIAPSTEVDRRTFSFDLIPSNVLDRVMIYKSGAPENTGDFAGGLIKIFTNNATDDHFMTFNLSVGYRHGTSFGDFLQTKGSPTDFLGFDNGYRQLPGTFPKENLRSLPNRSQIRVDAAKSLENNFANTKSTALPDMGLGWSMGRSWRLGGVKLSTISALSYSQSYMTYDKSFQRYLEWKDLSKPIEQRFNYVDTRYEKENKIGLFSNWALMINENHKIEFKNIFSQIGENISILREGEDFIQQTGLGRKNYLYQYRSKSIYSGQLNGTHKLSEKSSLTWMLGLNYLNEQQPDLRRFRTIETAANSNEYRMVLPPSSNLYDAGRYYGALSETGGSHGLNYKLVLGKDEATGITVKAGYLVDYRSRNFNTRYFSYFYPGSSSIERLQQLEKMPLDQIFAPQNFNVSDGFLLEEGTRASDSYDATNFLGAGYAGIVIPWKNFTLSGGFRLEYNRLKLNSSNDAGVNIAVDNEFISPLTFVNLDYKLNEKHVIRSAYYRSVNRPEFREMAPFLFYDYEFDAERYGNPDLTIATIENFDLRYEFYPRDGEMISIGGFYKYFKNPIETLILIRSESPAFSYQNALSAYNYGIELEFRKSLKGLANSSFLDRMSVNLNAAYIVSEVDYGKNNLLGQDSKRALQGQSPYIINAIVSYNDDVRKFQTSVSYNIFGKRIYAVGSDLFPTIYEMPRHAVDITVTKQLTKQWNLKLGVQNLLNFQHRFFQDSDRNGEIDFNVDDPIFRYRNGILFNASISYTIK